MSNKSVLCPVFSEHEEQLISILLVYRSAQQVCSLFPVSVSTFLGSTSLKIKVFGTNFGFGYTGTIPVTFNGFTKL